MKQRSVKLLRTVNIFYFLLLALFLYHVLFFTDMQDFIMAGKESGDRIYNTGWYLENGERVDLCDLVCGKLGGSYTVTKTLPRIMSETDSVYLSTSNLNFDVYVEDEQIYSYTTSENITGMGDGISYRMIGLGTRDEGKTIRIDARSSFADGSGGRINDMQYGKEELYRYSVISSNALTAFFSVIIMIFGIVLIIFYFGMFKEKKLVKSLWALGVSAVLMGFWSLFDTGIPQLTIGSIYASREIAYLMLHLACFPLVYFINSKTKQKKPIFSFLSLAFTVIFLGSVLFLRYVLGTDMHLMEPLIYLSFGSHILLIVIMLLENELWCRKHSVSSSLNFFYAGVAVFMIAAVIDMAKFYFGQKVSFGHGIFLRPGLLMLFLFMTMQIFYWWSVEKKSLERDRFVNNLLKYVTDSDEPESKIGRVLEYMCRELGADRAYIFEDMKNGTFDNTYEYCSEGVTPQIDNLKGLPYDGVVDCWYREYKKGGHILIYDMEKYRLVSENMYRVLKPQGINTLVTGPLILEGEYIGFFGVDNPPADTMKEISEIIRLLMYFLSDLIESRNYNKLLVEYSYHDAMTGALNRRAIKEFETNSLDTSKPYGFIMCDVNGLKKVNDNEGHDAGDDLIKKVYSCLVDRFGTGNVYRMGGDEFAAYVCDIRFQELEDMIDSLRKDVLEKGYHLAIGFSYSGGGDSDIRKHKLEADDKMYEEKRKYYRDAGDDT